MKSIIKQLYTILLVTVACLTVTDVVMTSNPAFVWTEMFGELYPAG